MSIILLISLAIRLAAVVICVRLVLRVRDWRIGLLLVTIALMALRQALTALRFDANWPLGGSVHLEELPGLLVSALILGSIFLLDQLIRRDRQAMQAQREETGQLRKLLDDSPLGMTIQAGFQPLYANNAFARTLGYGSASEIVDSSTFAELFTADAETQFSAAVTALMQGDPAPQQFELQATHRAGHGVCLEVYAQPVTWNGKPAVQFAYVNITERRKIEQQARSSERLLRAVFNHLPATVFAKDLQGRFVVVNPAFLEAFGADVSAVIGRTWPEVAAQFGVDAPAVQGTDDTVLREGETVTIERNEMRSQDRPTRIHRLIKAPIRDEDGQVVGLIGIGMNVTELVEAQRALEEREWMLARVLEIGRLGTWTRDLETGALQWGAGTRRIWGFAADVTKPTFDMLVERIHPDDRETFQNTRARVTREGGGFDETARIVWPDGSVHHVRTVAEVVTDTNGKPASLLGLTEDLTEREHAQQELREQEWMLTYAQEVAGIGTWLRDVKTGQGHWSSNLARIWGWDGQTTPTLQELAEHVHPDDRDAFMEVRREVMRNGGRFDQVSRAITSDGRIRYVRSVGEALADKSGTFDRIIGVSQDLTDRLEAEQALRDSEERFRAVVENLPYSYNIVDQADGRVVFANEAFRREFGITDALENHFAQEFYADPEDRVGVLEEYARTGRYGPRELRFRTADGRYLWVLASGMAIQYGGRPCYLSTWVDVSERRQAEAQLRESEAQYKDLVETSQHLIFRTDLEGRFLYLNPAWEGTLGYPLDEMLNRPFTDFKDPAEAERSFTAFAKMRDGEVVQGYPTIYLTRSGEERTLVIKGKPYRDPAGRILGVQGTAVDATEQVRAENELRASRRLLELIIDAIPMWIFAKDADSNYLMVNKAMAEFFQLTKEDFLHRHTSRLPSPAATQDKSLADDRWVYKHRETLDQPEVLLERPDGTPVPFHSTKIPLFDDSGDLIGLLGINRDVTEQKRVAEEREAHRQLLQALLETIPAPIFLKSAEGRYEMANTAMAKFYGTSIESIVGLHTSELPGIGPQEKAILMAEDEGVVSTGMPFVSPEVRRTAADGSHGIFQITKAPLKDSRGRVTHIVGHASDITDIKQAERALRESGQVLEQISDAVIVVDLQDRIMRWSKGAERLYGYLPDEVIGKPVSMLWPKDVDGATRQQALYREILPDEGSVAIVEREKKNGERFFISISLSDLKDEKGNTYGIVGTSHDVTDLVNAERSLRSSEERLRSIVSSSLNGIVVHRRFRPLFVNQAYAEIFGYDSPEEMMEMETLLPIFVPEELERIRRERAELRDSGQELPARFEITGVRKDGSQVHLLNYWRFVDWDGERAVLGTVIDISERKRMEDDLRSSTELLQTVFDTIPQFIFVKDPRGRYTMVGGQMAQQWGSAPEQMLGQRLAMEAQASPAEREVVIASDERVISTGETVEFERERVLADGRRHFLHTVKTPLRNPKGEIVGIVGVTQDLTERKRMEADLRASKELLQAVFDAFPNHLHVKDTDLRYRMVNRAFATDSRRTPEQMVGLRMEDLTFLTPEQQKALTDLERRVMETGEAVTVPGFSYTKPDGREVFETTVKYPLRNESGRVEGIVTYTMDVTETMLAQQELSRSERRYRDLVEGSIQGVLIHRDFHTLSVSQPLAEMLGYASVDELMHIENAWQLVAPASRDALSDVHARRQRGETVPTTMEIQMLTKGGDPIWVERRQRLIDWEGDEAVQVVIHNIHDRKMAEQELREKEQAAQRAYETLQLAISSSPAGLALYDDADRLITCNDQFRSYFPDGGVCIQSGMTFNEIVHAFTASGGLRYPERLGESWFSERIHQHTHPSEPVLLQIADGRWLQVTERRGENAFISTAYLDISELVKTQNDLKALNAQLEQRVQERTEELRSTQAELVSKERLATLGLLTGVVSHELRNPLGTIRTSAFTVREVTREHGLDLNQTLMRIDRNVDRCDRIIEELLAYTRPPRGDTEEAPLDALVTEVLRESIRVPEGIQIATDLTGQAILSVDRERIRRAVINVIQNAVQAITEQAGRTQGSVRIATRCSGGRYEILVRDDGPGIPEENRERLFEPLFSTKGFGVGLGLPIVKQIMEAHQGGIEIESDGHTGCTVRLWLPLDVNTTLN